MSRRKGPAGLRGRRCRTAALRTQATESSVASTAATVSPTPGVSFAPAVTGRREANSGAVGLCVRVCLRGSPFSLAVRGKGVLFLGLCTGWLDVRFWAAYFTTNPRISLGY